MPVMPKAKAKSLMKGRGQEGAVDADEQNKVQSKSLSNKSMGFNGHQTEAHTYTCTHTERKRDRERHTRVQQSLDLRKTSKVH